MDYTERIEYLLRHNRKADLLKFSKAKTTETLVTLLEREITNFSYDSEEDISYLANMFEVFVTLFDKDPEIKTKYYDKFTYIHNKIKNLLHAKPTNNSELVEKNFKELKAIIDVMENTMLQIYYNNPTDYDSNKEAFIEYIIFKLKYIKIFEQACTQFPHIVNSTDKDGIPLVEKVLDKYLESLEFYLSKPNLGPIDDLIYYSKVLKSIINSEKINIDEYNKRLMLEKIKEFYQTRTYENNRHKEKLSYFINDIFDIITQNEKEETLEDLNYKYEVHEKFKAAHNAEARRIYNTFITLPELTTTRKIYTFDGEHAMEIDDGLSLIQENGIYHLGVHIAYPGGYIDERSILMDEAKRRTTSVYFDNTCIPLFPLNLSGDLMSLNEQQKRKCISYYFDIDVKSGELLDFNIKHEICQVEKNMTYDEFNQILLHGCDDPELEETIHGLNDIQTILSRVYNKDQFYTEVHMGGIKPTTSSEKIVESAMIYTNYQVAKLFNEKGLPFIYRSHTINQEEIDRLTKIQDTLKDQSNTQKIVQNIEMIKTMFPRAYYTKENQGHYGLGIDFYSHVTSPLRRLADNIANMCIMKFLIGTYTDKDIEEMNRLIDETSEIINNKRAALDDYSILRARKK